MPALNWCRPGPGWPLPFLPQGLAGRMAVKVEQALDDELQKETSDEAAAGKPAAAQVGTCAALLPCCVGSHEC